MRVGVGLSKGGAVERVVILYFEEERGKPVADKSFLKQYVGKDAKSPLRLGDDIDAITGATVSSKSVTEAVRKAIALWDAVILKKAE
jgi:Na+-translocating ferredoxin:NAD+ oxidoreductase RnfG subunit